MRDETYKTLRRLLFCLPPETAHALALSAIATRAKMSPLQKPPAVLSRRVMGLDFANPVGLAAGFDKNAKYVDALAALGVGFIEVGGITPRPQFGNPRPRLFRVEKEKAIINRMGFNNCGASVAAQNLTRRRFCGVVGINIGKNANTPPQESAKDYISVLQTLYSRGDFFTLNISSPNTKGLQDLQHGENLRALLKAVVNERGRLEKIHNRRAPLAIKISPDLSDEELSDIANIVVAEKIDGVIACNTTTARPHRIAVQPNGLQSGGLSGKPLAQKTTEVIRFLRKRLPDSVAIIGVGGIFCGEDAKEKLAAGANLLQLYSGLIYEGPCLPMKILKELPPE